MFLAAMFGRPAQRLLDLLELLEGDHRLVLASVALPVPVDDAGVHWVCQDSIHTAE